MSTARRPRWAAATRLRGLPLVMALLLAAAPGADGQETDRRHTLRTAVAVSPDTVRVGEPFTLGVAATGAPGPVQFPSLLNLTGDVEQLEVASADAEGGARGEWRVRYRLVSWTAGQLRPAPIRIAWRGGEAEVQVPPVEVLSVLPAEPDAPLELRPPRPPTAARSLLWLLLLALAALALLLGWLLWRRAARGRVEAAPVPDPATTAREALAALRAAAEAGAVAPDAFYDGVEAIVREYLRRRRGSPPELPVRVVVDPGRDAALLPVQERAGLARFAGVGTGVAAAVTDADVCLGWLERCEAEVAG